MTRLALILGALAVTIFVLAVASFVSAIVAHAACPPGAPMAPRDKVAVSLSDEFAETQRNFALGKKTVVEVFASGAGTWTIIETGPDGKSCILAAGTRWRKAAPAKQGGPA